MSCFALPFLIIIQPLMSLISCSIVSVYVHSYYLFSVLNATNVVMIRTNNSRGRLAQTGERLLSNIAIRGQIYVEEVFFCAEVRSSIYHETSFKLNARHQLKKKSCGNITDGWIKVDLILSQLWRKGHVAWINWSYDVWQMLSYTLLNQHCNSQKYQSYSLTNDGAQDVDRKEPR